MTDEEQIRAAMDETSAAITAKDAAGAVKHYAPGVLRFDLAPPLMTTGDAGAGDMAGLEEWFATWRGPIGHEMRDVAVRIGGDLAVATSLVHMTGEKVDGGAQNLWFRITIVFARGRGTWKVVHEHGSVPFLMDGSGRAALDLKP